MFKSGYKTAAERGSREIAKAMVWLRQIEAGRDSPGFWPAGQKLRIPPRKARRALLPPPIKRPACAGQFIGGGGGIRTPGNRKATPDFESGTFNHSATPPLA